MSVFVNPQALQKYLDAIELEGNNAPADAMQVSDTDVDAMSTS